MHLQNHLFSCVPVHGAILILFCSGLYPQIGSTWNLLRISQSTARGLSYRVMFRSHNELSQPELNFADTNYSQLFGRPPTSYRKSKGNGILRSKSVSPFPLTQQHTTMLGLLESTLRPVLSLPLKAPATQNSACYGKIYFCPTSRNCSNRLGTPAKFPPKVSYNCRKRELALLFRRLSQPVSAQWLWPESANEHNVAMAKGTEKDREGKKEMGCKLRVHRLGYAHQCVNTVSSSVGRISHLVAITGKPHRIDVARQTHGGDLKRGTTSINTRFSQTTMRIFMIGGVAGTLRTIGELHNNAIQSVLGSFCTKRFLV